jgi:death-on-curing protein
MSEPVWVAKPVVLALHEAQLSEHGGLSGLRDEGLLESALAKPRNLHAFGEPDLAALAASYAFGLAKNHPFADGNKRASYIVTRTFLLLNGADFDAGKEERVTTWLALAAGTLSEDALATWLRARLRKAAP